MPRLAGPSKVDDPRSPILASPHTWKEGFLLRENSAFCRLRPNKERKERDKNCCVCKEGLSVHWVGGLLSGYQLISISGGAQYKNYS